MVSEALFSSNTDEWFTPQDVFNKLNEEFHFELDAAASIENHKCERFFSLENDALTQTWGYVQDYLQLRPVHAVFLNPPFSKIAQFVEKAAYESMDGPTIVALLPSRTDVRWFHKWIYQKEHVEIRFLKGRLKFGGAKNSAPFGSMVVVFYSYKSK
jgi:phage N-6-adenine-methyltransferase